MSYTMYGRGRQYSRGGGAGGQQQQPQQHQQLSQQQNNQDPPRRRRFRGHYVRRRTPDGGYRAGSFSDYRNDSSPPPPPPQHQHHQQQHHQQQQQHQQHHHHHHQQHHQQQHSNNDEAMHSLKTDIDEIKALFSKLSTDLDQVRTRVKELESVAKSFKQTSSNRDHNNQSSAPSATGGGVIRESGDWNEQNEKDKRRKVKLLKQREKKAARLADKRAAISENASQQQPVTDHVVNSSATDKPLDSNSTQNADQTTAASTSTKFSNRRTNRERNNADNRRVRREPKEKPTKPLPKVNWSAEPSSEDRPEGDDGREGGAKERVRVFRRKKQHFGRQGNRRRRADSSERNSNDTSPQGDANGSTYKDKRKTTRNQPRINKTYPELSESELNASVQTLKREFLNLERPLKALKGTMNTQGPVVGTEFATSILDHAMCDVTSPTKLSEIANSLYLLLVSDDNTSELDFQKCFYDALSDISKREDDIAIDAPRYMDTLGQVLADCIIPMNTKHRHLVKKFLNGCLTAYLQNKATLLASIMKAIASSKNERFAKEIWDTAQLKWKNFLDDEEKLDEFLESHEVKFTTKAFSPEPQKQKKSPKELEKFADDVTRLVEERCTSQALEDLMKELVYEPDERVEYLGTLIYAIVRGCLVIDTETDSESEWKLSNEALNKYSSVLNTKHEDQDAIALNALTALTILWHQYNCPQDLFRTILLALHNQGTVSYENLKSWLELESLNNIPGIGAARLNSKRYIQDLGASLKAS